MVVAVSSGKKRRLRESPLLQPLTRKCVPTASAPSLPHLTRHEPRLSKETRRKWLLEALQIADSTSLSQRLEEKLLNSPLHLRSVETASIEDAPVVATPAEILLATTLPSPEEPPIGQSSMPSPKRAPGCGPSYTSLPLYERGADKRSPRKSPLKPSPLKTSSRFSIAPLISKEMLVKLQAHLEDKIRGDIWQNEVRSRLARPLSATVFSNRDEQLSHELTAPQFIPPGGSNQRASTPLYPYSQETHDWTRRVDRMYQKHCFRRDILIAVRRLAVAIRYFRRVIVPWLTKAFRRRRRAAVLIQRRLRRHFHWKRTVLHSFAVKFVSSVLKRGCLLVKARYVFSTKLRQLVSVRKAKEAHARERRRVLFRWVAKTRVALFVHTRWCVDWFRRKREHNLARMRLQVQQLEDSDKAVQTEYATIFNTAFGRKLLKKELTQWRQSIKTKPIGAVAAVSSREGEAPSDTVLRLRQCFNIFDLDGSGTLDLEEFELMLAYLRSSLTKNATTKETKRAKLTTAQVRDLFETLDVDGNGKVTCDEFQGWWTGQHTTSNSNDVASGSASVALLSTGLDRLVLTGHGLLFWLLGKKQQLEKKFVKKLLIKKAQDSAKRVILEQFRRDESTSTDTKRCGDCARCFGLRRDLTEHTQHDCPSRQPPNQSVVDTFIWRKWIREEELRLLEDAPREEEDANESEEASERTLENEGS